jgi:UDP-glucuronate decarboxylase
MNSEDGFTGPVNLGNPDEFTIAQLAERVTALAGGNLQIRHMPLPEDDPRQRQPDISLARDKLGWRPSVALAEGLTMTFAYFRELLDPSSPQPVAALAPDIAR